MWSGGLARGAVRWGVKDNSHARHRFVLVTFTLEDGVRCPDEAYLAERDGQSA